MARRHQPAAAEALEEIESAADRLGEWLQTHLRLVLVSVGGLLALAGLASWMIAAREGAEKEASAALAKARADYFSAMGAGPGALEVPELANPEAAAQIREDYRQRFGEVAQRYGGTVAGALAALESARLAHQAGDVEAALAGAEQALEQAPTSPALRGMLHQKLAQWLEDAGRWGEAAQHHEQAAELDDYPLHAWALADAARCAEQAGDLEHALALYDRLEAEAPELRLPDYQRVRMEALRAKLAR